MIKVLHIIPGLGKGGAERLCLDICNAFSKQDEVQVKLITFSEKNEYPFLTKNIDWDVIPSTIKLSLARRNQLNVSGLQAAVNEFQPDIIHTHLFEAEIVSKSILYPNTKWFSHCHDNMMQFRNLDVKTLFSKQSLTNYYEKCFLFKRYKINGGNHFIAISKNTQAYFEKTAKPYPVTLFPNAIDYHKFCKKKPRQKNDTVLRLINIGSFVEKKNQAFLLDVANILKKRRVPFELHLLGEGVKRPELEIQAKMLGLEKKVIFHGMVNEVEKLLWQSDLYVHSANYEPLGLVLLEAMAAGLPVVTLDGKGNRDLIIQGKNGSMLFVQDAEKFADKVIEVWTNKALCREMSSFAQKFAKGYDIKNYVERLLEIYRKTL